MERRWCSRTECVAQYGISRPTWIQGKQPVWSGIGRGAHLQSNARGLLWSKGGAVKLTDHECGFQLQSSGSGAGEDSVWIERAHPGSNRRGFTSHLVTTVFEHGGRQWPLLERRGCSLVDWRECGFQHGISPPTWIQGQQPVWSVIRHGAHLQANARGLHWSEGGAVGRMVCGHYVVTKKRYTWSEICYTTNLAGRLHRDTDQKSKMEGVSSWGRFLEGTEYEFCRHHSRLYILV